MPSVNKTETIQLNQWQSNESPKMDDFNSDNLKIDNKFKVHDTQLSDLVYQTAGGTATAITLIIKGTLVNGYPITFVASANNSGAVTTINGKKLYKPSTTISPNLIAGKAYTVWYNLSGDCFFIKASAEGDAIASNVLAGKKFSNDNDTGLVGTLDLSNLVTGNIKSGVTINGVSGSSTVVNTADASLDPAYLVQGYSGYDDGIKKSGQLANNTGVWQYAQSVQPASGRLHMFPPRGLYDPAGGTGVYFDSADYIASNIVNNKNVFGLIGNATIASLGGRNFASNTAVTSSSTKAFPNTCGGTTSLRYFSIRGLPFVPSIIIGWNNNNQYYTIYSSGSIFGAGVLYNEYRTGSTSGGGGSIVPIANSASVQLSSADYDIPIQQYAGYNVSWWAFG